MTTRRVWLLAVTLLCVHAKPECNPAWSSDITENWYNNNLSENICESSDRSNLRLVHVIFRHGDRTPDPNGRYPKDPYYNETYYPIGYGQLTNIGKMQEYKIGKSLRKQYGDFLGNIYYPEILDARSTNYNRTKMSLELALAGMWPPNLEQIWNQELPWLPIPYNYWIASEDKLLDPEAACPVVKELHEEYLKSDEFQQHNNKFKHFYQYVSYYTGLNITQPQHLYDLFFTLYAEEQLGFPLPDWTKCVWPNMITNMAIEYYKTLTFSSEIKQFTAGNLLSKIVEDSKQFINGTMDPDGRKMFLYSAHELNIALVLIGLKLFHPHVPPYASYIIIELHEILGEYGFQILYQDYQSEHPRILTIPGCECFCRFDRFYEIFKDELPPNSCSQLVN